MKYLANIYQITPYYPPNLGGMQKCAEIFSEFLAHKGHNVTVLTSNVGVTHPSKLSKRGKLNIKYLKSLEFAHTPISFGLFFELIKIPSNSIVHIHIANAFYPELVYIASLIKNFKYVAHIHIDVQSSGVFGVFLPIYKKFLLKLVLRRAHTVICLTETFSNLAKKYYGIKQNKLIVIPNGVDKKFFVTIRNKSENNILFVGRLSAQKNLKTLIRAMTFINPKTKLHIVGEGELREELTKLIEELQLKNVFLQGYSHGDALLNYYKNANLFILPSKNEGMSLAMLEAMASRLPVVATSIPQTKDFVSDGVILIDNPTPENIASVIKKVLKNTQKMEDMGNMNYLIAKKYTWTNTCNRIEEVYKNII